MGHSPRWYKHNWHTVKWAQALGEVERDVRTTLQPLMSKKQRNQMEKVDDEKQKIISETNLSQWQDTKWDKFNWWYKNDSVIYIQQVFNPLIKSSINSFTDHFLINCMCLKTLFFLFVFFSFLFFFCKTTHSTKECWKSKFNHLFTARKKNSKSYVLQRPSTLSVVKVNAQQEQVKRLQQNKYNLWKDQCSLNFYQTKSKACHSHSVGARSINLTE